MNATEAPAERVVQNLFPSVRCTVDELLGDYRDSYAELHALIRAGIDEGRRERNECSLPLLVHAAETGDPAPAVPIAAVHALWWRAANALDDTADGDAVGTLYGAPTGAMLLAALDCGYVLPLRLLTGLGVPQSMRSALLADFMDGWTAAHNGQIRDLVHEAGTVDCDAVLATYRDKSGSAYRMAAGMSARLAGCDDDRIRSWRRFGTTLGLLAQIRNDAEDVADGPAEDLKNGTATYLLARLLDSASEPHRQDLLAQLRRARHDLAARQDLRRQLLDRRELVHEHIEELRIEAHAILDDLDGDPLFVDALRTRVDAAAHDPTAPLATTSS